MNRLPQNQKLTIPGSAGALEAIFEFPGAGEIAGAALVCHPHPQHGGTMHNKVVHTLARSFVRCGFAALRFNFRGTESSEGSYDDGVGELDDALTALAWLRQKLSDGPLWLAGFSFGAAIAVRAAAAAGVDGLIAVAPAIHRFAGQLEGQPECPWLVVQGDADELVEVDETVAWLNSLEPGPELLIVPGAEHFFHGRLNDLREAVIEFCTRHREEQPP